MRVSPNKCCPLKAEWSTAPERAPDSPAADYLSDRTWLQFLSTVTLQQAAEEDTDQQCSSHKDATGMNMSCLH